MMEYRGKGEAFVGSAGILPALSGIPPDTANMPAAAGKMPALPFNIHDSRSNDSLSNANRTHI